MLTCFAVKEELLKLVTARSVHVGVLSGSFRYIDAAALVIRLTGDFEGTEKAYKTKVTKFLAPYKELEPEGFTVSDFPLRFLGLATEHFCKARCSQEDVGDVLDRILESKPSAKAKRQKFAHAPSAIDNDLAPITDDRPHAIVALDREPYQDFTDICHSSEPRIGN